jgi:hypothetical protein
VSRDPTGTLRLRQQFRADAQRRARQIILGTRWMMIEADMLGLDPRSTWTAPGTILAGVVTRQKKLRMFSDWFNGAAYSYLVADGRWIKHFLDLAYESGTEAATKWTKFDHEPQVDPIHHELVRRELNGITDATVQQATRVVANGLLARAPVRAMHRGVAEIVKKVTVNRCNALCNMSTVRLHNIGRLDQFRLAGAQTVGIEPETLPPRHRHDGMTRDEDVEVVTAEDDDVCEVCIDIAAQGPYELDEAESLIPAHPNCRCSFMPTEGSLFFAPGEARETV